MRLGMKSLFPTFIVIFTVVPLAGLAVSPVVYADQGLIEVKEPAVAGQFYPADSAQCANEIDSYVAAVNPELKPTDRILAFIVPHAGIMFSGPVAGYAYSLVEKIQPKTVILAGPSHHMRFDGIALYDRGYFRTSLGMLPVDTAVAARLTQASSQIKYYPDPFVREHNLEVQMPFLQRTCPKVKIVPLIMGSQSREEVSHLTEVLTEILPKTDALLIASTDLSHYHPAETAITLDQVCMDDVHDLAGKRLLNHLAAGKTEMCGGGPATVALMTAKALGADVGRILKYGDSGDVGPKDKSAVVGYLAAALVDTTNDSQQSSLPIQTKGQVMELTDAQKERLLTIARETITQYVNTGKEKKWTNEDPVLDQPSGAFVTLKEFGQLRGCIGHVEAKAPLYETVAQCAIASAAHDPRFRPVGPSEIPELHIEISVMTEPKPISSVDEIVVGRDGLIIEKGPNRGLLLPQVPVEWGWDRDEYLKHLCAKAGLGPDEWQSGATIYAFQALVFGEEEKAK